MMFALYFLFILVMTHALDALPFSGPGYYGHKFYKQGTEVPAFKASILKPVLKFPWIWSVPFPKLSQNISPPFSGQSTYSLQVPYLYKYPFAVMTSIQMNASKGKSFMDNLPKSKNLYDLSPYSFFKLASIKSPYMPFSVKSQDTKTSPKNPEVSENNLPNAKPKVLFIKGITKPFSDQKQFIAEELSVYPDNVSRDSGPFSNPDNDILAIDIVNTENQVPHREPKPMNRPEVFDVISVPFSDQSKPNDHGTVVNGPVVDSLVPKVADKMDTLAIKANTQDLDNPVPNLDTSVPAADINVEEPNVEIVPGTGDIVAPVENTNTAIMIGDIPGFVVDGGSAIEAIPGPTHIIPDVMKHSQTIDILNVHDVAIPAENTGVVTDLNFGINPRGNVPLLSKSGGILDFTGASDVNNHMGLGMNNDLSNIGIRSDLVITGANKEGLGAGLLSENEPSVILSVSTPAIHSGDVSTSVLNSQGQILKTDIIQSVGVENGVDVSDGNVMIPEIDSGNARETSTSDNEQDQNNPNPGSIVIIRPVPYLMNIEPFGPGPYGQCRAPARVVCGVRYGWEHVTGMAEWCQRNCVVFMYSSYCDDDRCQCECM